MPCVFTHSVIVGDANPTFRCTWGYSYGVRSADSIHVMLVTFSVMTEADDVAVGAFD